MAYHINLMRGAKTSKQTLVMTISDPRVVATIVAALGELEGSGVEADDVRAVVDERLVDAEANIAYLNTTILELQAKNRELTEAARRDRAALEAMQTRQTSVRFFGGPVDGWENQRADLPPWIDIEQGGSKARYNRVQLPCGHHAYIAQGKE